MSIAQLIIKAKRAFKPKPIGLSEDILSRHKPTSFWLRPVNELQSQNMVGSYLRAMKDDLRNGGYIFVKKSRAPDVIRQLAEQGASYQAVHFERMEEISEIIDLENPKALWVVVEDDSLAYDILAARYRVAETALRSKLAPALGAPIDEAACRLELQRRKAKGVRLLMFIEMDYPLSKGFSVIVSQCRALRIATCRVTRESSQDDEIKSLFGQSANCPDELKFMAANSVQVYGSGAKNHAQCTEEFNRYLKREPLRMNQREGETPEQALGIDLDLLRQPSALALILGFGDPALVDITK